MRTGSVPHIAIVGAGLSGLTAAWRLHERSLRTGRPLRLSVFEASPRLGGVVQTERYGDFLMEGGPESFVSEKPRGIALCHDVGLQNAILGTQAEYRRSFIVKKAKLYPVPEGFYLMGPARPTTFLSSPLISWRGKLRAMMEPWIPADSTHDESVASFVRRRFGNEMLERFAQPLMAGIYAADPEELSLRATFPQFLEMERAHGSVVMGLRKGFSHAKQASGARYSLFVTLRQGFESLIQALCRPIRDSLYRQQPVKAISALATGGWRLSFLNGESHMFDAVCLAIPAVQTEKLLRTFDAQAARELTGIPTGHSATLYLGFRESDIAHPLNGFGFVTPRVEKRAVPACTFMHRKYSGRAPQHHALLKVFLGGREQQTFLQRDDCDIAQTVLADLRELLGLKNGPLFTRLFRHRDALPRYTLGHLERMARFRQRLTLHPGLVVAGNWISGIGVPDCIESGERAAQSLWDYVDHLEGQKKRTAPMAMANVLPQAF